VPAEKWGTARTCEHAKRNGGSAGAIPGPPQLKGLKK